jgi:predicted ester cyclase
MKTIYGFHWKRIELGGCSEEMPKRLLAQSALTEEEPVPDNTDNTANTAAAAVHRLYEAMNTGDEKMVDDVVNNVLAPGWQNTPLPPGVTSGAEAFRGTVAFLRTVFPDFTITHEDFVVTGDKVGVRSVSCGTHSAELLGVTPTGRKVSYRAFDFHRIENGRIAESWHLEDNFALLNQLGASFTKGSGS